ncbi:MAG: hypothetical protein M3Q55_01640 [Acidobacteriota bacterium]|nr:hypothetical protein [Acidobacteriota bacterium]
MRTRRVVVVLAVCAVVAIGVFGFLASRAVTVEEAPAPDALRRFESIRMALGGREPLIGLDEAGNVIRRASPPLTTPRPVTRLGVIAYQSAEQRLVTADVPMWFFRMKGPPTQFLVRGTGLDLERLQITARDLERFDPSVVIDHARANGDRLLVWTE